MNCLIVGIIQARFEATRLPGKVLLPLAGKSVLEHVVTRVKASKKIDEVIVATSINHKDKKIVDLCDSIGVKVFRGSEEDVLDRFYHASQLVNPEHIVRITADCPAIDPGIIDEVIKEHVAKKADYTSNTIMSTYPDGEDVEIFRIDALKDAWTKAMLSSEREHVTPYIKNKPNSFKLVNVTHSPDLSKNRWTLDEERDYKFLGIIFDNLYASNHAFGMNDILDFLKNNPHIEEINKDIMRNEGYQKSLEKDKSGKIAEAL